MITITSSVDIDRPADDVFAVVTDFPRNPTWQRGMKRCAWTSEPPLRVGSTYTQHARFLGKDLTNAFEVTELDPGRRVRFASTGGTFPIRVTRSVDALSPSASRFTEEVEGDARGAFRLAQPVLRVLVRRAVRRDLPRLKALLEGS